jgi:Lrp/AsnC family leucine-responsive transcriptional regulator
MTGHATIDETDRLILAELKKNARASFTEIGAAVGLTRPAVRERIRRLEDEGVIMGYTALVDPAPLGSPIRAVITIKLKQNVSGDTSADAISRQLLSLPEVRRFINVTGDTDGIVEADFPTMAAIDAFYNRISRMGYLMTTYLVLYDSADRKEPE